MRRNLLDGVCRLYNRSGAQYVFWRVLRYTVKLFVLGVCKFLLKNTQSLKMYLIFPKEAI